MRYLIIFALITSLAAPALAQDSAPDPAQLERIAQEQAKAKARRDKLAADRAATLSEIDRLRGDLVTAAAEAESYEMASRDIAARLSEFSSEADELSADIFKDRAALSDLLAALQRIERNPPPALAIRPEDAKDAAQAARLLTVLSEDLQQRAAALSARLSNLSLVRDAIAQEQARLTASEQDVSKRRAAIQSVVAQKQELEQSISEKKASEDARIARLAAEAQDLRDLIARFEAIAQEAEPRLKPGAGAISGQSGIPVPRVKPRKDRPPTPVVQGPQTGRFADARGRLRTPAQGRIVTGYNQTSRSGETSKGLYVQTRPQAQVIAPFSGRLEFVGAFKNYDQVVILNVGDGYFILMTGLGQTYGKKGQSVSAGEPVGLMPAPGTRPPQLYVEIRKDGAPVNPSSWLSAAYN